MYVKKATNRVDRRNVSGRGIGQTDHVRECDPTLDDSPCDAKPPSTPLVATRSHPPAVHHLHLRDSWIQRNNRALSMLTCALLMTSSCSCSGSWIQCSNLARKRPAGEHEHAHDFTDTPYMPFLNRRERDPHGYSKDQCMADLLKTAEHHNDRVGKWMLFPVSGVLHLLLRLSLSLARSLSLSFSLSRFRSVSLLLLYTSHHLSRSVSLSRSLSLLISRTQRCSRVPIV